MKLTSFLILFLVMSGHASTYSQATKLNVQVTNGTFVDVLKLIEKQSDFYFYYNTDDIRTIGEVSISVSDKKVEEILDQLLKGTDLEYKVIDKYIVLKKKGDFGSELTESQQTKSVSGKVTDSSGSPLPGVSVVVKGTTSGVITDMDGKYSIAKVPENAILKFSFVGMKPQEVKVETQNSINVVLTEETIGLDEVIAIGYGTVKKSDLTGSVSSVGSKDFKAQPVTRIDQVLQGRAAGVQVVNNAGAPGGDVSVRIRGSNSILGNNNPLYVVDGFVGADFNNINPNDVESVELLKDASSTAIYGSRGANGVVLITTKKGNKDKPTIEFSSTITSANVLKKFGLLHAGDFATTVNQKNKDLGLNPAYTQEQIDGYYKNGGTDWQDEIFRNAIGQEYQLSISGGKDKTNYLVSGNYLNEDGIILGSGFKRYSVRSNINSNISEKFKLSFNVSGVRKESRNTQGIDGKNSPLTQALAWAPTTPVYDNSGNFIDKDPVGSIAYNPVALCLDRINDYATTNANILARGNYEIIKGLTIDVLLGVDYISGQGGYFGDNSVSNNTPYNARYTSEIINFLNTNTINYSHIFNEVHSLTVTGVYENQSITNNGFTATSSKLLFPDLTYYNLSLVGSSSNSAAYIGSGIVSFVGRVNYAYKDKYLLTASVRRDGSSKFQGNNKYSTFPSVAAAWKLSEEEFIKNMNLFSRLKLRASYGLTGSQAIEPYATMSTYTSDAGTSFTNSSLSPNLLIGNPANTDLTWETTKSLDFGIDMGFLDNRFGLGIDWYNKKTTDLLMPQPVPAYLGGGSIVSNIGEIDNSGLEFSLNYSTVANRDFVWTSDLMFSFLNNEVISLGDLEIYYFDPNVGAGLTPQPEFVLKPGYGVGSYWGLKYLGTWKPSEAEAAKLYGSKPGDSKYEDVNNDKKITSTDYQIIGNGMPKTSFGWNNTFQYKNFSLNLFFQALTGYDKLNLTYGAAIAQSADARQATLTDINERYITGVNETSDIPAFSSSSQNYLQSTRFMEKGDFFRLKNVNLSYDVPVKNMGLRVFIGATNLFTITDYKGIDPETSSGNSGNDLTQSIDYGSYPNSKRIFGGVVFKF